MNCWVAYRDAKALYSADMLRRGGDTRGRAAQRHGVAQTRIAMELQGCEPKRKGRVERCDVKARHRLAKERKGNDTRGLVALDTAANCGKRKDTGDDNPTGHHKKV